MEYVKGMKFDTKDGVVSGIFDTYWNEGSLSDVIMIKRFWGPMKEGDTFRESDYNIYFFDIFKRLPEYAL